MSSSKYAEATLDPAGRAMIWYHMPQHFWRLMMRKFFELVRQEPVHFYGVLQSGIILLTTFGLQLSPDQTGAILVFVQQTLSFLTRVSVTPNQEVKEKVETALNTIPPFPVAGKDNQ